MKRRPVVFDASVGVKWFRSEPGSDEARRLRGEHIAGEIVIAVDHLFLYEVMAVVSRGAGPGQVERAWRDIERLDLAAVPPSRELVSAAARQRALLGCSLYDAFSAGLAQLLGAPLYSADERAHATFPNVRIVGCG